MGKRNREEPRRPFKNVNFTRVLIRALFIYFFIGIAFLCSYWRDEGVLGTGWFRNSLADLFAIFQYPALDIFFNIGFYTWTTYLFGLFIDAYLWSVSIAIILYILSKIFKTRDAFLLRPIGLLLMIIGIIIIIFAEELNFTKPLNIITYANLLNTEHELSKKTYLVFSGFITLVVGWVLISFSISKKKAEHSKDISIR
jgi:hypothetical protein